jgi:hypothetical protein
MLEQLIEQARNTYHCLALLVWFSGEPLCAKRTVRRRSIVGGLFPYQPKSVLDNSEYLSPLAGLECQLQLKLNSPIAGSAARFGWSRSAGTQMSMASLMS